LTLGKILPPKPLPNEAWADNVPQMFRYHGNQTAQRAIAQHYGIATTLIDLTTDPTVALFFAQDGEKQSKGEAVIYCLQTQQLAQSQDIDLVRIDVENLWRLEAQRGLFIDCRSKKSAEFVYRSAIKVFFKPSINDADASNKIYPNRKSSLELSIDEWLYRNTLENTLAVASKNATIIRKTKNAYLRRCLSVATISRAKRGVDAQLHGMAVTIG